MHSLTLKSPPFLSHASRERQASLYKESRESLQLQNRSGIASLMSATLTTGSLRINCSREKTAIASGGLTERNGLEPLLPCGDQRYFAASQQFHLGHVIVGALLTRTDARDDPSTSYAERRDPDPSAAASAGHRTSAPLNTEDQDDSCDDLPCHCRHESSPASPSNSSASRTHWLSSHQRWKRRLKNSPSARRDALWSLLAYAPRFQLVVSLCNVFSARVPAVCRLTSLSGTGSSAWKLYFTCSTRRRSSVRKLSDTTLDATRMTLSLSLCISDDARCIYFYISLKYVDTIIEI